MPDIYQSDRVHTNKSDAPGLPCMSLINIIEQLVISALLNNTDMNKPMHSYGAHFPVWCCKTGCTCLDAFHVLKYALMLAPAPKPLVQVVVPLVSTEIIVTCKHRVMQAK